MDIGTGLALLGSAQVVSKLLGPTADYIGSGIQTWTEKRVGNVRNIFANASTKLGPRLDEPGFVPPRVLKGILDEGSFCEDPIATEYFGGVLASSRTDSPRDDRGASLIALLGRLSIYQIRAHYVLYHVTKLVLDGTLQNVNTKELGPMYIWHGFDSFDHAMAFEEGEKVQYDNLLGHTFLGLYIEREVDYALGNKRRNCFRSVSAGSGTVPLGTWTWRVV